MLREMGGTLYEALKSFEDWLEKHATDTQRIGDARQMAAQCLGPPSGASPVHPGPPGGMQFWIQLP